MQKYFGDMISDCISTKSNLSTSIHIERTSEPLKFPNYLNYIDFMLETH